MDPAIVQKRMKSLFPIPDAVFLLDIDPALSAYRISHSRGEEPNYFEERSNLAKAREIFNNLRSPEVFRVDGPMSREAVHGQIIDLFIEGPLKTRRCAKSYGCDNILACSYRILGNCEWFTIARALNALKQEAR